MVSSAALSLLLLPSFALASFNLLNLADDVPQVPTTGDNPACLAAYNATIECDAEIITGDFSLDNLPSEAWLDKICTSTCLNSLRKWVRGGEGCEGEEYLNYFGVMNDTNFFDGYPFTIADIQQYYITSVYHYKCLTDLNPQPNQPKYCLLKNATTENEVYTPGIFNVSNPDAFCVENTCAAQSAYLWAPVNVTYKFDPADFTVDRDENQETPMISFAEACPNADTSKFPRRESEITTADLESGDPDASTSNGGDGSGSSGSGSGNNTGSEDSPNAAAGRVVGSNILFSLGIVVVGFMVL
ncbi:hypothetical protein ABW19_dt0204595 [Dactylella cylindrospora]|nr:hypothetical protein ABW19_dt0204595 [Dactylella cylindrospora]